MGRVFSFLALLAVLAVGAWFYMHQAQNTISAGTANPTASVDLMGVRNDLLAMGQAERSHAATSGGYVSLDELRSRGELSMSRDHRGPYTYSSEISGTGFRITATYVGPANSGMPKSLSIDETMQVTQE